MVWAMLAGGAVWGGAASAQPLPVDVSWSTVANNLDAIPDAGAATFNSYNQPSVNATGAVVFRARSKGPSPVSGIYLRDMLLAGSPIERIADRSTVVPWPNNTFYQPGGSLATFNEFPSIPRISMWSTTAATRGNSQPVWTYLLDGADTKVGTNGIFVRRGAQLTTAIGLLGAVPPPPDAVVGADYFPYMAVPGVTPATRFDVFPGSPALSGRDWVVFKGNYTENGVGRTGVFFRDPFGAGGVRPTELIANTDTVIPNLPAGVSGIPFGSTAPPSAAGDEMVFVGLDDEASPSYGGIYLAPLAPDPALTTLVGIGDPVPGEAGATFNRFGEGLAFDGRYVAFWGAWGAETVQLWLDCPTDGNADVLAYCRDQFGDDYPVDVPANQGIFVIDTQTGLLTRVARTGAGLSDFVYWNFSGRPPGAGGSEDEDGEPPRWRAASFVAVAGGPDDTFLAAFKARSGDVDPTTHTYLDPVDGIHVADATDSATLLDTTMDGRSLDPAAPPGSTISALGIEREGLRGHWLAVTAAMLEPVSGESMAGIYTTRLIQDTPLSQVVSGTYRGLLLPVDSPKARPSRIRVFREGRFTGQVFVGGAARPVAGRLDASGKASVAVRVRRDRLVLQLEAATVGDVPFLDMTLIGGELNRTGSAVLVR